MLLRVRTRTPLAQPQSSPPTSVSASPRPDAVVVSFDEPMDPASVEDNLVLRPATEMQTTWSADHRKLTLRPSGAVADGPTLPGHGRGLGQAGARRRAWRGQGAQLHDPDSPERVRVRSAPAVGPRTAAGQSTGAGHCHRLRHRRWRGAGRHAADRRPGRHAGRRQRPDGHSDLIHRTHGHVRCRGALQHSAAGPRQHHLARQPDDIYAARAAEGGHALLGHPGRRARWGGQSAGRRRQLLVHHPGGRGAGPLHAGTARHQRKGQAGDPALQPADEHRCHDGRHQGGGPDHWASHPRPGGLAARRHAAALPLQRAVAARRPDRGQPRQGQQGQGRQRGQRQLDVPHAAGPRSRRRSR